MKIKIKIYYLFFLVLILAASCSTSKKMQYLQSTEQRQGKVIANIPSYLFNNTIRFQPDDILGITVNVPGEQSVASDYNLPLIPLATTENSTEEGVSQSIGRQAFLIGKDGTIDFPVLGIMKVAGYTQTEMEKYMKERLSEKLLTPSVVTVRLMNFTITITGEVNRPGAYTVSKDHINILEALALAGDMTMYGKRDDIVLIRPKPDGNYQRISLDISKESIISSPYYFLHQNDALYVMPTKSKSQSADTSPWLSIGMGVTSFLMSVVTFTLLFVKK